MSPAPPKASTALRPIHKNDLLIQKARFLNKEAGFFVFEHHHIQRPNGPDTMPISPYLWA